MRRLPVLIVFLAIPAFGSEKCHPAEPMIRIQSPMTPPPWALLERELLRANTAACKEFYARYFDERGWLKCVERWGGDDGPDDAIENCADWPVLHALGASDEILRLYKKAWEGHLQQYTQAKTTKVPFAREGMYFKEFPVQFDWLHNGEGLRVFNLQGLSDPNNPLFRQRVKRFAGFYLNEDPGAQNYDPKHKIIRSMFNGSRGPLLRKATGLDWAGDPIEIKNRFALRHGEENYEQMLAHFKDYNDIVGDHPQNMVSTTLAMNAYALTHQPKYKKWILEYVDAWRLRTIENKGIIPTNVGRDGKIGSDANGKWYGGVYGWGFSVEVPQTGKLAHRNTHYLGLIGFGNAYLLTGDDKYLDVWRKMTDLINAQGKMMKGRMVYPTMYGDQGWYEFVPQKYTQGAFEIWYWSMKETDLERMPNNAWVNFLQGKDPEFPERQLRADFAKIRAKVQGMRKDTTTPDTRLADDPMRFNPATVGTLNRLMQGGLDQGRSGQPLHCRLRYFDPMHRRAGVPEDVAALIERMSANETVVTLVNVNQLKPRTVTIQAGGYGEHQFTSVGWGNKQMPLQSSTLTVQLKPGCGVKLRLGTKRYVNPPTLRFPWTPQWAN